MLTGTKLLNHVFDLSAKQNISEIYLHVQTNNDDAIAFYKKFGFEITQTIHNYYMNITPPDCYVLTKFIGQAATKKWSAAGPTFCETTITTSWVMAEIVAVLWQSCCVSIFVSSNAIDVWVALLQNWDHHLHCDYSFFPPSCFGAWICAWTNSWFDLFMGELWSYMGIGVGFCTPTRACILMNYDIWISGMLALVKSRTVHMCQVWPSFICIGVLR